MLRWWNSSSASSSSSSASSNRTRVVGVPFPMPVALCLRAVVVELVAPGRVMPLVLLVVELRREEDRILHLLSQMVVLAAVPGQDNFPPPLRRLGLVG